MRILKTKPFARFAGKEGIADESLKDAVDRLEKGQVDADLGGGVYKQRVARSGAGRSGGFRVLVCYRRGDRSFFVYGFAKSDQPNIDKREEKDFKKMAKSLFALTESDLEKAISEGTFVEIA
ncbi:type II toxin-antitoxin system RelE/ParE family toxin [Desulfovibrio aminophilus]|nr:type II toxin-antitoxin system RelE/ParE family toxin [Desulfovibrio aminophilus]MCM0754810.1 type II toxin-antitoxin system RelE/ParE family toxin [Desulfovibrio aminophilus]